MLCMQHVIAGPLPLLPSLCQQSVAIQCWQPKSVSDSHTATGTEAILWTGASLAPMAAELGSVPAAAEHQPKAA